MTLLISSLERVARKSRTDPLNPSGVVHWVTSTDFYELESAATFAKEGDVYSAKKFNVHGEEISSRDTLMPRDKTLAAGVSLQLDPLGSWQYKTKTNAVLTVDESALDAAKEHFRLVEISELYHAVARAFVRRDLFMKLWLDEESSYTGERTHAQNLNWHLRPTQEELTKYHDGKIRRKIADLLVAGEWVDDPDSLDSPSAAEAVEELNDLMESHPMGRQSHLRFSSDAGQRRGFGRRPPPDALTLEARANPYVVEYLAVDPLTKRRLKSQNPTLTYLLRKAALD